MNSTVSRVGTTIRKGFVIAWLAGVGLWALADNKLEGVLSIALLVLVLYVSARLGGWSKSHHEDEIDPLRPTDDEWHYDPTYNAYAGNSFHKHYHPKR
jgi:hypothetical protein